MKDRIGPFISRISPVLKRRSSGQSPSRDIPPDNVFDSSASEMLFSASKDASKEDLVNMSSCSIDSSMVQSEGQSLLAEEACLRCKALLSDYQNLQEEKGQSDKLLIKAREEAQMLSDLIKDMEHKWTEVAKDYEKQVST